MIAALLPPFFLLQSHCQLFTVFFLLLLERLATVAQPGLVTFYNASLPKDPLKFSQLKLPGPHECPITCSCAHTTVICTGQQLTRVPADLPRDTTRLDLQENRIGRIRVEDFAGLNHLKILQLMDNQIEVIASGAFDNLTSLERLRLNRNRLRSLPDFLFAKNERLRRLDLSENSLSVLTDEQLAGPREMANLQLDRNQLNCLDHRAIADWEHTLEVLTLNSNNLNTLGELPVERMPNLRVLRLADNPWHCDCRLKWLKRVKMAAANVKCHRPTILFGRLLDSVSGHQMKCSGMEKRAMSLCRGDTSVCPSVCSCMESGGLAKGTTVDCHDRGLRHVPANLPKDTVELRLEQNQIQFVPNNSFHQLNQLIRLDLSKNQIREIAPNAFHGLTSLNTLMLFANNLTDLPPDLFSPLGQLQLLLLNTNRLRCLRSEVFRGLGRLQLLSLYDNQIQSIANGTFAPFIDSSTLQTLHLAKNPLICDCNLEWLSALLANRTLETSGARCHAPRRLARRRLSTLAPEKFRCKGAETFVTQNAGACFIDNQCPVECVCHGTTVDCSGRQLSDVPKDLPRFTTHLLLKRNRIKRIGVESGLGHTLPNLQILDLSENMISTIDNGSLDGAESLRELDLSGNQLKQFSSEMLGTAAQHLTKLLLDGNLLQCATASTFGGLQNLHSLSLAGNQLRSVTDGTFVRLAHLHNIQLSGNPFVCNCHLRDFVRTVRHRHKLLLDSPKCNEPKDLRNRPLTELDEAKLSCDNESAETSVCAENGRYCPAGCTCDETRVRCSGRQLRDFPSGIGPETTELFLDNNQITDVVPEQLANLSSLTKLDLSNNRISRLQNGTFAKLARLSTLILSYNSLRCLEPEAFAELFQLRILSLHGNNLSQLPETAFVPLLTNLTHIALGGNPLWCDCEMNWLSRWVKARFVEPGIARCEAPAPVRNQLLLTASQFACTADGPPKEVRAKCNACANSPCQNGGNCRPPMGQCDCAAGFHGAQCQHRIDACFGDPCQNGAICQLIQEGRFRCECTAGFVGERCETNVDDCLGHKCQNGATCVDEVNAYRCECPQLFTGHFCEKSVQFCSAIDGLNPCENGAKCIPIEGKKNRTPNANNYRCVCAEGWTGRNCSENIDDCASRPCQNGGTCLDRLRTFECQCPADYSGQFCEQFTPRVAAASISAVFPRALFADEECSTENCENGHCVPSEEDEMDEHAEGGSMEEIASRSHLFPNSRLALTGDGGKSYCRCVHGFGGRACRVQIAVGLQRTNSYLSLAHWSAISNKTHTKGVRNLTLTLRTLNRNGVIAYQGDEKTFVAMELYEGRVKGTFYIGNYPPSHLYSYALVNDGQPHRLEALIEGKTLSIRIDGHSGQSVVNSGKVDTYNPSIAHNLHIGGLPMSVISKALSSFHVKDVTSFRGCITNLHINGQLRDLRRDALESYETTAGCIPSIDLCLGVDCNGHGACQLNSSIPEGFQCLCKDGYRGNNCQKRMVRCIKEKRREHFVDGECRSVELIKTARCSGFCGSDDDSCCVAVRAKRRRVKMHCRNGSTKTTSIDIVRKCVCRNECKRTSHLPVIVF